MDFGLKVSRILSQAGNFVVDLVWTHVRGVQGYNIYRAESNSDDPNDWYKINVKIIQVNYFQDRGLTGDPIANNRIAWFYKVIPILQDSSEWKLSQSSSATFDSPLFGMQKFVAQTIRSRTHIMLDPSRFSAAEPVHFLVRMWAGIYCACVDVRARKVNANCKECYGTGYSGGYQLIEDVYCRVKSSPMRLNGDSGGITVSEGTTGTIATYPLLTDADIIIRRHNMRYRVRDVKQRAIQGYITAQSFTLEKMQLYDAAYNVPVPPIVEPSQRFNRGSGVSNVLR
jgi:hypothetical protein